MEERRWSVDGSRFAVILGEPFSDKLWIPKPFAQAFFENGETQTVYLAVKDSFQWPVDVIREEDEVYFGQGWDQWCTSVRIEQEDGLYFAYDGKGNFQVEIFDRWGMNQAQIGDGEDEPDQPVINCSQYKSVNLKADASTIISQVDKNQGTLTSVVSATSRGKGLAIEIGEGSNAAEKRAAAKEVLKQLDDTVLSQVDWARNYSDDSSDDEKRLKLKGPALPNLNAEPETESKDDQEDIFSVTGDQELGSGSVVPFPVGNGGFPWRPDVLPVPNLYFPQQPAPFQMGVPWPGLGSFHNYALAIAEYQAFGCPTSALEQAALTWAAYHAPPPDMVQPEVQVPEHQAPQAEQAPANPPVLQPLLPMNEDEGVDENQVHNGDHHIDMPAVTGVPDGWQNYRITEVRIRSSAVQSRFTFTIPIRFARAQLLRGDHGRIMKIRGDFTNKTWQVMCKMDKTYTKARIVHGWKTFAIENYMHQDDAWRVEVHPNDPEIWLWRKLPV